jgi:rhodanese-related sulfurtransferase
MNTSPFSIAAPTEVHNNKSTALLLDVRTPAEYAEAHIDGSTLRPLHELRPDEVRSLASQKTATYLICRSGNRAKQAAEKLSQSGMTSLKVMEGGIMAWENEGLPLTRGRQTISLERQVRIAAGALVFAGALLGYFVSPAWIALSGFIGAGLVFAGVTDTCGMAMALARMPWNNRPQKSCETDKKSCCSI